MSQKTIGIWQVGSHHMWGSSDFGNVSLIDASGEKHAYTFAAPKDGSITKIGFRTGTVTTPQTLRVGLETVSTNPTGTQAGGSAVGTQTSPASNTWYEVTLATPATVTRGVLYAIVIQFDSTVGNLNIARWGSNGNYELPYCSLFTGSWSKNFSGGVHSVCYSDGTYPPIPSMAPASAIQEFGFGSSSSPDERALKFKNPMAATLYGVTGRAAIGGSNSGVWTVYDSDGTTSLGGVTVAAADQVDTGNNFMNYTFTTPIPLKANTFYYLAWKSNNTNNVWMYEFTVSVNAMLDHVPGGKDYYLSTRTDAGAWTDTTTKRPFMSPIYEGVPGDDNPGQRITSIQSAGNY